MSVEEDNNNLDELSLTTTIKGEGRGPVWEKIVPDL